MRSRVTTTSMTAATLLLVLLAACSGDGDAASGDGSSPQPTSSSTDTTPATEEPTEPVVEGKTFDSGSGATIVLPQGWRKNPVSIDGINVITEPRRGVEPQGVQVSLGTMLFSSGGMDDLERILTDGEGEEWTRLPDAEFSGRPTLVLESVDVLDRRVVKYAQISSGAALMVTFAIQDLTNTPEDERSSEAIEQFIASTMSTWHVE